MNTTMLWLVVGIGRLAFFGMLWANHYKYEKALLCFLTIFVGVCYGLLLSFRFAD